MLTAESEGGQRKSHPYWLPDRYGQMKVKALSEKRVSLESSSNLSPNYKKPPLISPLERPAQGRRRATNPHGSATQETATVSSESEPPSITVRKLTLNHASFPFQPLREITQIHYSAWPDFGAPANPNDILGLIEHCDAAIRSHNGQSNSNSRLPAPSGERPILVHCSAGCGRTGTFCTVDSVIDMLKQQRKAQQELPRRSSVDDDEMDVDDHSEWVDRDDTDLVEKSVRDFRLQRLSMVQTLRQYVLCYETVLEWMVKEMPEKFRRDAMRRSYHG